FGIVAAVVLQRELPLLRNSGQLGVADDIFAVEIHPKAIALHRNLERVPLTTRAVSLLFGRNAGSNFRRHAAIGTVAVDLSGADRPHPDVYLALGRAAQV